MHLWEFVLVVNTAPYWFLVAIYRFWSDLVILKLWKQSKVYRFSRTWCERGAPFWIQTPRSTGTRSRGRTGAPLVCSAALRSTPTRWHKTSGRPTWSPSPSSPTTWVSASKHLCAGTCGVSRFCVRPLLSVSVLTVDYLDVSDPLRATLPRFQDIQESFPKELGSSVRFPRFNAHTQVQKGRSVCSGVRLINSRKPTLSHQTLLAWRSGKMTKIIRKKG